MKTVTKIFVSIGAVVALTSCASIAPKETIDSVPLDGRAKREDGTFSLKYSVGISIAAPRSTVWNILTDAPRYPQWNSTVTTIQGQIKDGESIKLKVKIAPDRDFDLKVSTDVVNGGMIWQDGTPGIFKGIRTYALYDGLNGATNFVMIEHFAGAMLPMIKGSLPDFTQDFNAFAADLKHVAESRR